MSATARTINLSWSPPLPKQQNGIITSYGLSCSAGGSSATHTAIVSTTSHTFSGLEPFTSYTCSVHASTVVGDGPAAIKTVVTDEDSKLLFTIQFNWYHYSELLIISYKFLKQLQKISEVLLCLRHLLHSIGTPQPNPMV